MSQAEMGRCYHFADLCLDVGQRCVRRGSKTIPLAKLSYEMLRALVEASPDVVGPERFRVEVWNGRFVTPETITQRVKLLRSALSDTASEPRYLAVVRGQGYRLVPRVSAAQCARGAKRKLAVLPFDTLSPHREDYYFAAGIHEEILNELGGSELFEVLARTSVRQYEHTLKPITEIARELGVDVVIEGSVRYDTDRIRITVQLIDGTTGMHLESEAYEHSTEGSFDCQISVARQVARLLARRPSA